MDQNTVQEIAAQASEAKTASIRLLKEVGVSEFNQLRQEMEKLDFLHIDLAVAILSDNDLSGVNFRRADLRGAHLNNCVFAGAELLFAELKGADLTGADLTGARNLTEGQLRRARSIEGALLPADLAHLASS